MFDMNIRFQILSLAIVIIIMIDYFRYSRLKTLSAKYFKALLGVTVINLLLDMFSVYTITHMDSVSAFENRLAHQLFIGSVIASMFVSCLYVMIIGREQKRIRLMRMAVMSIPLMISVLVILFGPLEYYVSENAAYSKGFMSYAVYVCGFVYLVMEFLITFSKKYSLNRDQKLSVRFVMIIWLLIMVIQITYPRILLSGTALTMIVLCIYLSFENQKEHMDIEIGGFNSFAFHHMLDEYCEGNMPLYLINISCDNYTRIQSIFGHETATKALCDIKQLVQSSLSNEVFHSKNNVLSVFLHSAPESYKERVEQLSTELDRLNLSGARIQYHIGIMDLRKYTDTKDEVFELMDFMISELKGSDETIVFLDDSIANQKIRSDKIYRLLEESLENDGYEMYYQPIYSPETKSFQSSEALLRLKHFEDLGYVSPEEFIPIAERRGIILEIGERVMELVADFIEKNQPMNFGVEYIEVNLSAMQAVTPRIADDLMRILNSRGIDPSFVNLEITETAMIENMDNLQSNMRELKELGFSFSMDDFGTGYSNLAQMVSNSYDLIKLDKSLIWPAFGQGMKKDDVVSKEEQQKAMELLDSIIKMLKRLKLKIVAEGVETEEMAEFLISAGVEHLQGYYYSKPISAPEYMRKIS